MNYIKKEKLLQELYNKTLSKYEYKKLITHFGNLNSKIIILGLEPITDHYNSNSKSIFKFDLDLEQTKRRKSGSIIIEIFEELELDIENYFWNNIYLVPRGINKHKKMFERLLMKEIEIIEPKIILCLGSEVYNAVNEIDLRIKIIRISHPARVLYGYPFVSYSNEWKKVLKIIK